MRNHLGTPVISLCAASLLVLPLAAGSNPDFIGGGSGGVFLLARDGIDGGNGNRGGRGGNGGYGPGDGTGTADDRTLDGAGRRAGIFCTRT